MSNALALSSYREVAADDQPVTAKLSDADTSTLFAMAEKLNYFRDPLESGLKVANTGKKTFRYEDGTVPAQKPFSITRSNPMAQQLLERLEQICSVRAGSTRSGSRAFTSTN